MCGVVAAGGRPAEREAVDGQLPGPVRGAGGGLRAGRGGLVRGPRVGGGAETTRPLAALHPALLGRAALHIPLRAVRQTCPGTIASQWNVSTYLW